MIFRRIRNRTTAKPHTKQSNFKSLSTVIRNIVKYRNLVQYPETLRLEVLDDEGDLMYYFDAKTNTEEIYRADGSITSTLMKMGVQG